MPGDFSSFFEAEPSSHSPAHEFIILAVALQSVALVLLDIGNAAEINATGMYSQEQNDIYNELSTIMELVASFDGSKSLSAVELDKIRKNLLHPIKKLTELTLQLQSFHLQNKITTSVQ